MVGMLRSKQTDQSSDSTMIGRYNGTEQANPSLQDGLPDHLIQQALHQAVGLFFSLAKRLNCRTEVVAMASALYQGFFRLRSMARNDRFLVAMGSFYVASKIEGRHKKAKDVILAAYDERFGGSHHSLRRGSAGTEELDQIKKNLFEVEAILLFEVGGIYFKNDIPHKTVVRILDELDLGGMQNEERYELHQLLWSLANDSLFTALCTMFSGEEIGKGLVELAVELSGCSVDVAPLWRGQENGVSIAIEIKRQMRGVYNLDPPRP